MATNPYLEGQANAITQTATQNLKQNILPGISSGAIAAGGYGGSRQGVAEANAIGQTNQGITNSLANLYGNAYQADQNYNLGLGALGLQNQGQRLNYDLGQGSLGLQNQAQNYNFYTQQRGLDQSGAQLGANLYSLGNLGFLGQGQGISGIGNTVQQAPWTPAQNAGNIFSQFSGLGGAQTSSLQGNPISGAIGGGIAGAQIGNNLGFGQTYGTAPTVASTPNAGFGTGYYYGNQDLGGYF